MTSKEKLLETLERTDQIVRKWPQWKRTVSHKQHPVTKETQRDKEKSY